MWTCTVGVVGLRGFTGNNSLYIYIYTICYICIFIYIYIYIHEIVVWDLWMGSQAPDLGTVALWHASRLGVPISAPLWAWLALFLSVYSPLPFLIGDWAGAIIECLLAHHCGIKCVRNQPLWHQVCVASFVESRLRILHDVDFQVGRMTPPLFI